MTDPGQRYADTRCPGAGQPCVYAEDIEQLQTTVGVLADLVITDELTGLNNFRHFMKSLDIEMERTRRTGDPVCLIILDLDDFKNINDLYGHEVGNQMLVKVSDVLQSSLRKLDVSCRYGGEEFVVILPGTSLKDAVGLAERLRSRIAECCLEKGGEEVRITASFGLGVFHSSQTMTTKEFIDMADQQLLQAKSSGKNRILAPDDTAGDTAVTQDERDALFGD